MKRKLLPLLLSLALAVNLLPAARAASTASVEEMGQVLSALEIMTGNEHGDMMLARRVTRAEFTKLVVAASPYGKSVGASTSVSPYPDVPYSHWAAPYVEAAVASHLVNGYLDGTFHPDEEITLAMGVTMALRLLGYQDSDFSGAWPAGQMTLYHNLDLDEGISIGQNSPMTRQDAMYLFYNLLTAATKQGQPYIMTLGHGLNAAGEVDRVAVINSAMKGPVVVEGNWQSKIGFDPSTATVYRSGREANLSQLQSGDVVYYSKSMRTLWAYTSRVTWVYQSDLVTPGTSSPAALIISGKSYPIETSEAAYALSNLGPYRNGDTITLLLGRDGGVAAVADAGSTFTGTVYGVISAVVDAPYTDAGGNSYTAKTVMVSATDGNSYTYPVETKSSFKAGNLVQITAAAGGEAQVKRLGNASITGKVNAAGTKIGNTPLAENVQILDVNSDGGSVKLYAARLAGMSLNGDDVKYYKKNAAGEIDTLILNDATGDIYSYGVLTDVQETDLSMALMGGVYQYDVKGTSYVYGTEGSLFNLSEGPVKIEGPLQRPSKMSNLKSVKLNSVDVLTAMTQDNESFPLVDSVAVYELENGEYHFSSLERVRVGYTLTGYYDRSVADGGRIRVIVAKAK